jgi:hypothetical protein
MWTLWVKLISNISHSSILGTISISCERTQGMILTPIKNNQAIIIIVIKLLENKIIQTQLEKLFEHIKCLKTTLLQSKPKNHYREDPDYKIR